MPTSPSRPKLGISACLLGANVRYNGGHKASRLCLEDFARHFDFVPLCPEVAIGLGVPRPTLRLVGEATQPRAVASAVDSRDATLDHSAALRRYGAEQAGQLSELGGFIFMQKSPSCGLHRVKLYAEDGQPPMAGARGLFAEAFCAARPELPVEEEGRLHDPRLRENFVTRIYAHLDWLALCRAGLTHKAILDFHSRHKYQLLAHDPRQYAELGNARRVTPRELQDAQANETLGLPGSFETVGQLSNAYATILQYGLPEDYYNTYTATALAVTPAQLNALAARVVLPRQPVWIVVGDMSKIEAPIRALNLGQVRRIDVDGKALP